MTEPLSTGVLQHIAPGDLLIEANVRTEASITKQFVASIRENGVLVPIVAVRGEDGSLQVRAGQRRTLAAREAGLASVPVYITEAGTDTATRLVEQITENDQRMALSGTDRVVGIQALLDTGLSASKVAKKLAVSPERVKQSRAVANSAEAMGALRKRAVTLAEAAGIAEFEDDPEAVRRLMQAAGRSYFDHELQRLRDAREEAAARAEAEEAWAKLGYEVLEKHPGFDMKKVPLQSLVTKEGAPAGEEAVTDPTHWAVLLIEDSVFTDADGNPVDEGKIDWNTESNPKAEPLEGMLHANSVVESLVFLAKFYCRDPEAAGLTVDPRFVKLAEASKSLPDGAEPETAADLEAKAAAKAERKKVLTLNHAGASAEVVRREFIAGLLKRKTLPKTALTFVAQRLTANGTLLGSHRGDEVAGELLGASVRTGELLDHASEGRAGVVLLGMTLGALESLTPKSAWRSPNAESAAYLRFLVEQGYELSPVEEVVTGDRSPDECLEELS